MNIRSTARLAACAVSAMLCAAALPAAAAENTAQMTFRISAETTYFTEEALRQADAQTAGGMYIDNYTGISSMKVRLKSSAPLLIEDADFTRDSTRTEMDGKETVAKQCFFEDHGSTIFTRIAEDTGELMNIALWYGPGELMPQAGVIENPGSSFLSFRLRIPKGTKAGVYRCYISEDDVVMSSGIHNPDLFVNDGNGDEITVSLQSCEIVVEPDVLRGDVDCDGKVTVLDAQAALRYYGDFTVAKNDRTDENLRYALKTPYIHTAEKAANVDGNTRIDTNDSMAILRFAADTRIGNNPTWESCIR